MASLSFRLSGGLNSSTRTFARLPLVAKITAIAIFSWSTWPSGESTPISSWNRVLTLADRGAFFTIRSASRRREYSYSLIIVAEKSSLTWRSHAVLHALPVELSWRSIVDGSKLLALNQRWSWRKRDRVPSRSPWVLDTSSGMPSVFISNLITQEPAAIVSALAWPIERRDFIWRFFILKNCVVVQATSS